MEASTFIEAEPDNNCVLLIDVTTLRALPHARQALTETPSKVVLGSYHLAPSMIDEAPLVVEFHRRKALGEAVNLIIKGLDDEPPVSVDEPPFVTKFDCGSPLRERLCILKSHRDDEPARLIDKAGLVDVSGSAAEVDRCQSFCKAPGKIVFRGNDDSTRAIDIPILFAYSNHEACSCWPMASKRSASEESNGEEAVTQRED